MSIEYRKVQSASKEILTQGPGLSKLVLDTMKKVSDIVGATLGPGGLPVLVERFEHDMGGILTKDGVSVARSLGFQDPAAHCAMEVMREAASRTATEAGDGTTSSLVLGEAIVRLGNEYRKNNKRVSPQRIVRFLENQFKMVIEPAIKGLSIKVDSSTDEGRKLMKAVATISANGDEDLAEAVIQCFDLVGDEGNVTITENSGPSSYQVESIDGYPIPMGYEESCAKFYPKFINDPGTQMCRMEKPVFILYHGTLTDVNTAFGLLSKIGIGVEEGSYNHSNVVFVAIGFSETVLATFGAGWSIPNALRIFPLVVPKSAFANFQVEFLKDLSAITGANVFDSINKPLDSGQLEDLGPGLTGFECGRLRSSIIGRASSISAEWETRLLDQIDIVATQLKNPYSEYDKILLQERLGKLTGGIAKLRVIGASNGELKEKRDRAEDAVCAVRGAIKHGCLPGGGWTLLKVISLLEDNSINTNVLKPALMEPVYRLLFNCGMTDDEVQKVIDPILLAMKDGKTLVYDALDNKHGDAIEMGILDSTPAVLEAIRNSISAASNLSTLGGIICFRRDDQLEREEARATSSFMRDSQSQNEADLRS